MGEPNPATDGAQPGPGKPGDAQLRAAVDRIHRALDALDPSGSYYTGDVVADPSLPSVLPGFVNRDAQMQLNRGVAHDLVELTTATPDERTSQRQIRSRARAVRLVVHELLHLRTADPADGRRGEHHDHVKESHGARVLEEGVTDLMAVSVQPQVIRNLELPPNTTEALLAATPQAGYRGYMATVSAVLSDVSGSPGQFDDSLRTVARVNAADKAGTLADLKLARCDWVGKVPPAERDDLRTELAGTIERSLGRPAVEAAAYLPSTAISTAVGRQTVRDLDATLETARLRLYIDGGMAPANIREAQTETPPRRAGIRSGDGRNTDRTR